ncbi:MAG TPA: DUF1844 domain-containing protein [bacterium]
MIDKLSAEEREKFLFSFLIMSYQTSALMQMGQLKDPHTQKVEKNLENAKLSIDILGMLQEKTKNNLTKDEAELLENVLRELRLSYIKESSRASGTEKS